jgi:acyl carrier protein
MGKNFTPGYYEATQMTEWDSLRHVELMFEIEEKFGIVIPPNCIAELYSNTGILLDFLREHVLFMAPAI